MQNQFRASQSSSPKPGAPSSKLPPISKYYYGPAQGWTSAEASPVLNGNGSTWSLNSFSDVPPKLPPRPSLAPPGLPVNTSPQWMNNFPHQLHAPPPSAPPASEFANSYALMPDANDSSINTGWDSRPSSASLDTSAWGVEHNKPKHPQDSEVVPRPPLPPRPRHPQIQQQAFPHHVSNEHIPPRSTYGSNAPSARVSATTIDVPLFLQPVSYDPITAPPIPQKMQLSTQEPYSPTHSQPIPQRFPPPPPKIPLNEGSEAQSTKAASKRPRYNPQNSYDGGHQRESQTNLRRPHFDPQNSHSEEVSPNRWQPQKQGPNIPPPQFSSFTIDSALPSTQRQHAAANTLQRPQQRADHGRYEDDDEHFQADQKLHQSSISPVGPNDNDRWSPNLGRWEPTADYVPSPELQHAVLPHHDGRSLSTTDVSSNRATVSTPESHQTSNTSYREVEKQTGENKPQKQGDDSFYWHSGRSSTDAEEEHSQQGSTTATPGDSSIGQGSLGTATSTMNPQDEDLPVRSTNLSPSTFGPAGASALGFGGPSDWEYFGDYEAEDIDDEELYSRPRQPERDGMLGGTAELPADSPYTSNRPPQQEAVLPDLKATTQPRSPVPAVPDRSLARQSHTTGLQEDLAQKPAGFRGEMGSDFTQSPTSTSHQRSVSTDQPRPDLDDVIRAWSEAPYVGVSQNRTPNRREPVGNEDDRYHIAEASLASTPGEGVLGIDAMVKGAPSQHKLPGSIEQPKGLPEKPERNNGPTIAPLGIASVLRDSVEQRHFTPKQLTPRPSQADLTSPPDATIIESAPRSSGGSVKTGLDLIEYNKYFPKADETPTPSSANEHGKPTTQNVPFVAHIVEESFKKTPEKISQRSFHSVGQPTAKDIPSETARKASTDNLLQRPDTSGQLAQSSQGDLSSIPQHGHQPASQDMPQRSSEKAPLKEYSMLSTPFRDISPSESVLQPKVMEEIHKPHPSAPFLTDIHEELKIPHAAAPTSTPASNIARPAERSHLPQDPTSESATRTVPQGNIPKPPPMSPISNSIIQAPDVSSEKNEHEPLGNAIIPKASPSTAEAASDPYADLDPWGRASLNRFAAMLREEARASTNKEKLNIFNVFTNRESRLRVILYGTEEELVLSPKLKKQMEGAEKISEAVPQRKTTGIVKATVERASSLDLERSLKALPALPNDRTSVVRPRKVFPALDLETDVQQNQSVDGQSQSFESGSKPVVESPLDDAEYSPGGRPIVQRLARPKDDNRLPQNKDISRKELFDTATNPSRKGLGHHSPSSSAPILPEPETSLKEPAYTPPKYSEGGSEVKNYLTNRRSVYRPYASHTLESIGIGSSFDKELDVKIESSPTSSFTAPKSQYNIAALAKGYEGLPEKITTTKQKPPGPEEKPDLRRFVKADFDPLVLVLPNSGAVVHHSDRLSSLKAIMEAIPEDFGFIHQSVVTWDAKAKQQREENDKRRHARQVESEQKIDSLFDDHEIGYGDISELEADFKHSEAARKAEEDRAEYQTFVSDVFNVVWTHLHYELDQLIPHYEQYSRLMDDTLAGKDMFEESQDGLPLAATMNAFLALHQKSEIRHQKAFEAVLERDRRLKKTEISPWYTLSSIAKVKQLEKQFEDSEKRAIIEYCEQRDARANRLMDVLDQNTLRGVGANQDYMEAIMKAVRRIASGRAFASVPSSNEPAAGLEEVEKAKAITGLLTSSSEQIVQTFHIADMLLNSADYEVSVAKAKVAKADMATLVKLKEERMKEDQKLMRDLEHRLALIREDSRRTNDEIVKLMLFLGVQNGRADTANPQAISADAEHEVRVRKALEEAKRRNALKESGG